MRPESWARFCGFLVGRKAHLYAHIREPELLEFINRYNDEAGELLSSVDEGSGYCVEPAEMNKWATSMTVSVNATDGEMLSASAYSALPMEVEVKRNGAQWVVYSSDVAWRLIGYGFRLGAEQNAERIREQIPAAVHGEFDVGLALGEAP